MITVTQIQQEALAAEKGRRKREQREREGREMPAGETALDAVGEGMRAAADDAEAAKAFRDRGITEGPGRLMEPGRLEPESVDCGYIEAGHASEAPGAQPPRQNPMPRMVHYVPPSEPMAARVNPAAMTHYADGSPSEK